MDGAETLGLQESECVVVQVGERLMVCGSVVVAEGVSTEVAVRVVLMLREGVVVPPEEEKVRVGMRDGDEEPDLEEDIVTERVEWVWDT